MEVLDAQLYCWHLDRPSRPWRPGYHMQMRDVALNILLQSGVPMPPETLLSEMALTDDALATGVYDRLFDIVQRLDRAVAVWPTFPLTRRLGDTFEKFSGIRFMIDHLGIGHAPNAFGLPPRDPWELLPQTLAFAKQSNVSVKLTGAPALRPRESVGFGYGYGQVSGSTCVPLT